MASCVVVVVKIFLWVDLNDLNEKYNYLKKSFVIIFIKLTLNRPRNILEYIPNV